MKRRSTVLLMAILMVVAAGGLKQTLAQSTNYYPMSIPQPTAFQIAIPGEILKTAIRQQEEDRRNGGGTRQNAGRTRAASASIGARSVGRVSSGTTVFRPIGGTIVPQQLAKQFAKSPQDRQELEQAFVKCLNYYKEISNANGVALNDVARASSFYIEANYIVYSGSQGLTPEQGKGLRSSVSAALSADAAFQAMSAREKQKMYETAAIMGAYVVIGHDMAEKKNDRKAAAEFQQLAKENFEKLLGPIDKVSFTDSGIEFK